MITIFTLENGKIKNVSLEEITKNNVFWIRAISPTEKEITHLSEIISTDPSEITEHLVKDERPRLEKDKHIQIIFDTPFKDEHEILAIPVSIYIYKNIVLTIERKALKVMSKLDDQLNSNKYMNVLKYSPGHLVYNILDRINDDFLMHINTIGNMGDMLKRKAREFDSHDFEKIYDYSITLSFFHQSLAANLEVLNSLRKFPPSNFTRIDKSNFNELYFDALTLIDSANMERKVVANLFNLQTVISQQKLNNFMNKITLMSIIILIPTLIASIYGMNIEHLPFANSTYSFWIVTGMMIAVTSIVSLIVMNMSKVK